MMRRIRTILAATVAVFVASTAATAAGPFWIAVERGDARAVKALLAACEESRMPGIGDAKRLADWIEVCHEVGVDIRDEDGLSPLHIASALDRAEVATVLLAEGAEVDTIDGPERNTPLNYASVSLNPGVVVVLLAAGADVNVENRNGFTPLSEVCHESGATLEEHAEHLGMTLVDFVGLKREVVAALRGAGARFDGHCAGVD